MANVVSNIASFDVDTSKAVQQTQILINSLNKLQKEREELLRQGKSVVAIDKQIAQETQTLNTQLKQQVKTVEGVTAQTQSYNKVLNNLNNETKKAVLGQKRLDKEVGRTSNNIKKSTKSLKSNVRQLRAFRSLLSFGLGGFATQLFDLEAGFKALQDAIDPTIAVQNSLNEAVAESTVEVAKEQLQLESLIEVANDDKRSKTERKVALDKINEGYGKYLPNLLTEKDLNTDLLSVQDELNKKIVEAAANRIKLALIEERIKEALKEQIEQQQIRQKLDEAAVGGDFFAKAITGLEDFTGFDVSQVGISQSTKQIEDVIEFIKQSDISGLLSSTVDLTKEATRELNKAVTNTEGEVSKSAKSIGQNTRKEIKFLDGSLADLQKQLSKINKTIREQTSATDTQALTPLIQQAQELQKQIDAAKKLRDELENPPQEERTTFLTNEIEALDVVALKREEALAKLRRENEQLEINNITQQRTIQNTLNERLKTEGLSASKREEIEAEVEEERRKLDNETTTALIQNKLKILEITKQIAEEEGESVVDLTKQIEELKLELAELEGETVIKVDAEVDEPISKLDRLKNTVLNIADGLSQLGGEVANFLTAQVQNQIGLLDSAIAKQKSALDALVNNTETANAAQVQAERDRLDKLTQEREKATKKEQTIAKAQVALNAAVAIARAAAEGGGFASAITIAETLASLALGLSLANQQAEQAFYDGTLHVKRGKGEKKGRDTVKARLHEGEAVIPTATNQEYAKSVEAIFNKKVPSSILNSFVEGYQKGDLSNLTTLTPSLIPTPVPLGYDANMFKGMVEMDGLRDEIKGLRRDNKELVGFLGGLPRESHVFNEKGYRKFVSQKAENQKKTKKRFS